MSDSNSELIVSASIVIDAPADVIFNIVADPRQHARIDGSGTVQGVVEGPERLTLGAEFGVQMRKGIGYSMKNRVVEFSDGELIAWRHKGPHIWRYELAAEGSKVRVTESWDGTGYPAVVRALYKLSGLKGTQRSIEQTLVNLRDAAESDARSAQ